MDQGTGSQENGGSKEDGLGLLFQGTRWHPIVFIITTGESRVRLMSPALSLLVALGSWQSLAPSAVVVDPSIRNFDVAHISTATTSDFSDARNFCLLGKQSFPSLPHPQVGWLIEMGPHRVLLNLLISETCGRPQDDPECRERKG